MGFVDDHAGGLRQPLVLLLWHAHLKLVDRGDDYVSRTVELDGLIASPEATDAERLTGA
jgi:hypothetical protein